MIMERSEAVHTHTLVFVGETATKRYTSWDRGEHRREWAALQQIWCHKPGLVPRPLAAALDAQPPYITMSLVRGEPLRGALTPEQTAALTTAITQLWKVPTTPELGPWADDLAFARNLTNGPRPAAGAAAPAYDAAVTWWDGPDPELLRTRPTATVLGHRDPNLANYLWDGERVRIVDFEDARISDPATEVALLAEHASTRAVDTGRLCERFDVDGRRLLAARRLWAMYWLSLLLGRHALDRTNSQAERVLALLRRSSP
jgi:aminoglycoside phosphotransferase (APT) family kinase protein